MAQAAVSSFQVELEEAFPHVDPGVEPYGSRVLVQIRRAKSKTAGGIILTDDAKETEKWNTQIAKVISMGPLAFKNREKGTNWVEGDWCKPGDFIRINKYGGDRWEVPLGDDKSVAPALFAIFNDLDLLGRVTGDPLAIKAFV